MASLPITDFENLIYNVKIPVFTFGPADVVQVKLLHRIQRHEARTSTPLSGGYCKPHPRVKVLETMAKVPQKC